MAATILVGGLTISACSDAPRQGLRSSTSSTTSAAADRLVSQSSLYDVATLGEVAALSTDIIVGQVVKVERGPVIGDAEAPLGVMRVVVRITEVLAGDPDRSSVAILVTGFDPVTGEITRPEGEHHPAVGMEGIWFLHPTELPSQPGTFYVSTSAGQLLRGADSRVVTGGEEQASGIECGAAWRAALEKVRIIAATATEGDRPVPGVASPHADPSWRGNPCAADGDARGGDHE